MAEMKYNSLTEGEALGKRCHRVFLSNRACIASACMAWRWCTGIGEKERVERGEPQRGFCGLAGGE